MEHDEFHGVGGSYLLDPKTGKRTRVEDPEISSIPSPHGGEGQGEGVEGESSPPEDPASQPTDKPRKGVR